METNSKHIFYAPDIQTSNELPEEETQHCLKVLRCKKGDSICLTDGKGYFYNAVIDNISGKHCFFYIQESARQLPLLPITIHIGMAPTKNMERNEWFAEKATEIGLNELTFLNCWFSERENIKIERIRKIMVSAIKQSQNAYLPQLNEMTDFEQFIAKDFQGQKFIAHCYPEEKLNLKDVAHPNENTLILIGPEGDFSKEEVQKAIEFGFQPISLGKNRLRTETAALMACHTLVLMNQ